MQTTKKRKQDKPVVLTIKYPIANEPDMANFLRGALDAAIYNSATPTMVETINHMFCRFWNIYFKAEAQRKKFITVRVWYIYKRAKIKDADGALDVYLKFSVEGKLLGSFEL